MALIYNVPPADVWRSKLDKKEAITRLADVLNTVSVIKGTHELCARTQETIKLVEHFLNTGEFLLPVSQPATTEKEPEMAETHDKEDLTPAERDAAEREERNKLNRGRTAYAFMTEARKLQGLSKPNPWIELGASTRDLWNSFSDLTHMVSFGGWMNATDPDGVSAYWEYTELLKERYGGDSERYKEARQRYEQMKEILSAQ